LTLNVDFKPSEHQFVPEFWPIGNETEEYEQGDYKKRNAGERVNYIVIDFFQSQNRKFNLNSQIRQTFIIIIVLFLKNHQIF